jgi:hypothetical protein
MKQIESLIDKAKQIYDNVLMKCYDYRIDRFEKKLKRTIERRNGTFEKRMIQYSTAVWRKVKHRSNPRYSKK